MIRRNRCQPDAELLASDVKKVMYPLEEAIETATAWGGYFDGVMKSEVESIASQLINIKRKLIEVIVHARTFEDFYDRS